MLRLYHGDECLTIPPHDVESAQRSVISNSQYHKCSSRSSSCSSGIGSHDIVICMLACSKIEFK